MRKTLLCTPSRCGSHIIRYSIASETDCQMKITINYKDYNINPDNREIFYLERRDSYQWALTSLYNSFIFDKIDHKDDNVWTLEEQEDYYQKQLKIFEEPITLSYLHFVGLVERILLHKKIMRLYPSKHPVLYYEDLCIDPGRELSKWGFRFMPEKSSIKIKKIPYDEAFTNSDKFRKFWNQCVDQGKNYFKI
jgi:hypothetical protein